MKLLFAALILAFGVTAAEAANKKGSIDELTFVCMTKSQMIWTIENAGSGKLVCEFEAPGAYELLKIDDENPIARISFKRDGKTVKAWVLEVDVEDAR
ncbi:hypothetical protein [Nisaea sp.]|uniref:hypothetical protein n=1 Tax=Nisaea sp. TaxID=2024842 RepID=UPI002B266369|nr:hypothetical protein [Nisaea sp.]